LHFYIFFDKHYMPYEKNYIIPASIDVNSIEEYPILLMTRNGKGCQGA